MGTRSAHDSPGASRAQRRRCAGDASDERAITPVIGVALMIAVTVTLVVIVAPVVIAVSGDAGDPTPQAEFGFSYDEGVEPATTDTFGNTKSDVNGAGLMTIVLEDGQNIEAGKLEIRGGASGGTLSDADRYAPDDTVIPGEEIRVWVNRGDDIQIIWNDPNAGESAVLAEFAVRPTTDLPVFVPEPGEDCEWVEEQLASGSDLTIDGIVVDCDLSSYTVDDVDIVNGGAIVGDVPIGGDLNMDDGTVYIGDVQTAGTLTMDNGAEIGGEVVVNGSSTTSIQDSNVRGSVVVEGPVSVTSATIGGELDANGDLSVDDGIIEGQADATGDVTLTSGSRVLGDAKSAQTISLDDASEIDGDAKVPDVPTDLICNDGDSSTVAGVGCEEYKDPRYTVTIDDATQPVEGNTMEVNATVTNVGYESGSPTLDLEIDGTVEDSVTPLSVDGGTSEQTTLTWSTTSGDAGTHNGTVVAINDDGDVDDTDTEEVFVADDSRTRTGTVFEIDGNDNSLEIQTGDTVGYTVTATYDDGSTEDVTSSANVTVISGDSSDVTIDDAANEITGDDAGTVTIEGNESSFADTVDLTVSPPMADRTDVVGSSLGNPTVQFTLENTGSDPVEITDISVEGATATSGSVGKVDNDGNNETVGGGGYVNTQFIEIGGDSRSFDSNPTISGGATATFDLGEFRQSNNGKARGVSDVTFTLYFADGTSRQYTIT